MKLKNSNQQRLFAWILLGSLHAFILLQGIFLLNFYINRNYYAAEICIQKDIPNNCCQGSCVVEKTIQLNHDNNEDMPQWQSWFPEFILNSMVMTESIPQSRLRKNQILDPNLTSGYSIRLDRPPNFVG